jgi:hypothetical protein
VVIGGAFLDIEGCELRQCETTTVHLTDTSRVRITHSIIKSVAGHGVWTGGKVIDDIECLNDAGVGVGATA